MVRIFPIAYLISFILLWCGCAKDPFILPETGLVWPDKQRSYWPTAGWKQLPMSTLHVDSLDMLKADAFARADPLSRCLLVIKEGYIVFEAYYNDGDIDASTNVWSVTKSVTSALVGHVYDAGFISDTDTLMKGLMPDYPDFNDISLHHVLTQSTGLSWVESGPLWVDWILADDWVQSALDRGFVHEPGTVFHYSSANSHFLSALIFEITGQTPGLLAKTMLFDPLGISFHTVEVQPDYDTWSDYIVPFDQSWHRDPKGIECASFGLFLTARDMAKIGYLYLNRGMWDGQPVISDEWIRLSVTEHVTDIYDRYSYGYQWWITKVNGVPAFLASGYGGQMIGIVPSLDLVVVLKYEAENPQHPVQGTAHDDMYLFDLVVKAVQ